MNYKTLLEAQYEAERFLRIVEAARLEQSDRKDTDYLRISYRTSGALRRSSMDLTRKLADLRRSR